MLFRRYSHHKSSDKAETHGCGRWLAYGYYDVASHSHLRACYPYTVAANTYVPFTDMDSCPADGNAPPYTEARADTYTNGDADTHQDADVNGNTCSHRYTDCHTDANSYPADGNAHTNQHPDAASRATGY